MTELWLPIGDRDVVGGLHRRIAAFVEQHGSVVVEVELRDGSTLTVASLEDEPGGGFLTLVPHGDEPREVIVPLGAIARITLAAASDEHQLGFVLPPT
jgi:hypothetical protein